MQTIEPDQTPINPGFYQLAYCSMLKEPMSETEIEALVEHAQLNNLSNEVTGLLMIDHTLVVQWIEGRHSTVRKLWDKLQQDPRHHCIVKLLHRNYQEQRIYPDWTMQRVPREEIVAIVRSAKELDDMKLYLPNPWSPAISTLADFLDPPS
jgi:Sensors of blue-light using FAD